MSWQLVIDKSIRCKCLECGCIKVALWITSCLLTVLVIVNFSSEHRVSNSCPFDFYFPILCGSNSDLMQCCYYNLGHYCFPIRVLFKFLVLHGECF